MKIRPYKKDYTYSYTFGVFPTIELADAHPSAVFRIIVSSKLAKGYDLLKARADALRIPLVTDDQTIERLSPKENCFAIGLFRKFYAEPDPVKDHVVLVNPSDMGNVGTIIRTTVAFGIQDLVVIRPCADLFNPHTVRASMGALFRVRPCIYDSFDDYKKACPDRNFYPFMLNAEPMEETVPDKTRPGSLIFGNESSGLPAEFINLGKPVRIVHESTVDSLNLTIAAGIGIHWFKGGVK